MSVRQCIPIALAVLSCCFGGAAVAIAQPAPATTQPAVSDPSVMHPMVFFDAHGEANACGPGCSEWIAAEGKIENGTADRLQELLARLKGARPPIYFHSPGGLVTGSMLLGRLMRERKLTASVGHTIAMNCDRDPTSQKSCAAEIRAGHPIEAALDPRIAMCNSACVYALAGGSVRLIPPWISLGIHDVGVDPSAITRRLNAKTIETSKATADARLRRYLRDMGIDAGLVTQASAIPNASMALLKRDDAARFGLDGRQFGETAWQFVDKPRPAIRKTFFVRTDDGHYVNAVVSISCTAWLNTAAVAVFVRERLGSDTEAVAGQPVVSISMNGQDIRLARATADKFYGRSGQVPLKTLATVADDATIVLPGTEFGRQPGSSGDVTLAMAGFTAAFAHWRKACAEAEQQAQVAQSVSGMPALPDLLQSSPSATTVPPLRSEPLAIGASRLAVDATLGAPTKTVGATALYSYLSSTGEGKVMAGYFDGSGHMQRFARYVLKDGKVFDELSRSELNEGQELAAVRALLASPHGGGWPVSNVPATMTPSP